MTPFDRPQHIHPVVAYRGAAPITVAEQGARARVPCPTDWRPSGCHPEGVDLLPYQLEPALAMLRHGAVRVMIADAVGLGKTVQAGLVLAELARSDEASAGWSLRLPACASNGRAN